jgi:hypothetical protein
MDDRPNVAHARARLREVYIQHALRRFEEVFGPDATDIDAEAIQSVVEALNESTLVQNDPKTGFLRVQQATRANVWRLAGVNHEYVVQLAAMGRLLRELPDGLHDRVVLEYRKADLVVLLPDDGGLPSVLLQVEVKSKAADSEKEAREASVEGKPTHSRVAALQPERVAFVSGRLSDPKWRTLEAGELGPVTRTTWVEIGEFLRERLTTP